MSIEESRDFRTTLFVGLALIAAFLVIGWQNSRRGEDILECMMGKGDLHSENVYTECVDETKG